MGLVVSFDFLVCLALKLLNWACISYSSISPSQSLSSSSFVNSSSSTLAFLPAILPTPSCISTIFCWYSFSSASVLFSFADKTDCLFKRALVLFEFSNPPITPTTSPVFLKTLFPLIISPDNSLYFAATFLPDAILLNTFNNCSGVFISNFAGSPFTLAILLLNKFCNWIFILPKLFDLIKLLLPSPNFWTRAITYSSLKLSSVCFVLVEYSSFIVLNISWPNCSFTVDSKKFFISPIPLGSFIL